MTPSASCVERSLGALNNEIALKLSDGAKH